jgi:hypothetical protein
MKPVKAFLEFAAATAPSIKPKRPAISWTEKVSAGFI